MNCASFLMPPEQLYEKVLCKKIFFLICFLDSNCPSDIYFYSAVVHFKHSSIILPVCEFLNSCHDVPSIVTPLIKFNRELKIIVNKEHVFKSITVDFSMAMLNSISLAFNSVNFYTYLDMAFDELYSNNENQRKVN